MPQDSRRRTDAVDSYVLNRGWIERDDQHVPTYQEIVGDDQELVEDGDENATAGPSHPWGALDEDEFDEKADEFEATYNFRFEEPYVSIISF